MKVEEVVSFKDWMPTEKPREKLKTSGKKSLSEVELIALILRNGTPGKSCLDLGRKALALANYDIDTLGEMSLADLAAVSGLGESRAISIIAALELRNRSTSLIKNPKVATSRAAYELLKGSLADLAHEEFWVLYLNHSSKLILKTKISSGGLHSTVVDPRMVFSIALELKKTSSIILAHNHPSGSLTPSQSDIDLTNKLVAGGKLFDIQVVDHLILAGKNYCSFADSGLL